MSDPCGSMLSQCVRAALRSKEGNQRSVARSHFNKSKSFGLSEIEHRNNKICVATCSNSVRKFYLRLVQILTSADHGAAADLTMKNASAEAPCVFTPSQLHSRAAFSACLTVVGMKYLVFHVLQQNYDVPVPVRERSNRLSVS